GLRSDGGGNRKLANAGFFKRRILNELDSWQKAISKRIVESETFAEREKKAREIINDPGVNSILRPLLSAKVSDDLFEEALAIEVVLILTSLLTSEKVTEKFSIDVNGDLFAMMTREIIEQGLKKYCAVVSSESSDEIDDLESPDLDKEIAEYSDAL